MSTIALDRRPTSLTTRSDRHLSSVPMTVTDRPTAQVRLTRRGKLLILAATVVMIAALAVMFGPSTVATDQSGTPLQTSSVTVMPGHTLWQIAADANPNGDIRRTVDDIVRLNSLPNASALQMGTTVAVPVYK